ncbi:streptomycin biosynthesis protein [Nonomuraea candida]|uniref:streptomycin biosynthesis protein n=1 Tax=Nonomuraea candida TaxID=359159 RepID=UPI0034E07B6C
MHRLRAVALRGDKTIPVRFFEGDECDAFVIAVRENTTHGLPLSVADRTAAAGRIVRSHPQWSDRAIARIVGLSAQTVSSIRSVILPREAQPSARLGRDGRVRPMDSTAGRIRAAELIEAEPHSSLRRIAKEAGVSPNTVRDVRNRLRRGEGPLPGSSRSVEVTEGSLPPDQPAAVSVQLQDIALGAAKVPRSMGSPKLDQSRKSPLNTLIRDPALRSAERGRLLLRMLSASATLVPTRAQLIDAIPEHCVELVYQVAKESAAAWEEFAEDLQRRTERDRTSASAQREC